MGSGDCGNRALSRRLMDFFAVEEVRHKLDNTGGRGQATEWEKWTCVNGLERSRKALLLETGAGEGCAEEDAPCAQAVRRRRRARGTSLVSLRVGE